MRRMFFMTLLFVLIAGCANSGRMQMKSGLVFPDQASTSDARVEQTGNRDVVNWSPSVAVTGGGGVALLILAGMFLTTRKPRKALNAIVRTIETLDNPQGKRLKTRIAKEALGTGVADYLHGQVKKSTSNPHADFLRRHPNDDLRKVIQKA